MAAQKILKSSLRFITLVVALSSCEKIEKEDTAVIPKRVDIVLTRNETEVLEAGKNFSIDLFKSIAEEQDYRNVILSPLSIHIASCMLANGAEGETRSQITNALGYGNYSLEDLNSSYKTLIEGLKKVDTSTELYSANSIWLNNEIPISTEFKNKLSTNYDASANNVDLHSGKAGTVINEWCKKHTGGMIIEAAPQITPETVMLLVNASYFNGKWKEPFYIQSTVKSDFYNLQGNNIKKSFMRQGKKHLFGETEDGKVKMCEIPFGNGAFVMDVILPSTSVNFQEFVQNLTYEKLESMFTYKAYHFINLSLPKFKFESAYDLKKTLSSMGITLIYDKKNSDFGLITKDRNVFINNTFQKSIIEIDEKGAKAASITSHKSDVALLYSPSDKIDFIADHPFIFIIKEITSGTIIYIGSITE